MKITLEDTEFLVGILGEIDASESLSSKDKLIRLRQVVEEFLDELTKCKLDRPSTLFARLLFVCDEYSVPSSLQDGIHSFRKLANKAVHDLRFMPTEDEYQQAVSVVKEFIRYFVPELTRVSLTGKLDTTQNIQNVSNLESLGQSTTEVPSQLDFVRCVVRRSEPEQMYTRPSDGRVFRYTRLICSVEEPAHIDTIAINCWGQWSKIGHQAKAYSTLHAFNLRHVTGYDDCYSTTAETTIVVEPDILINATDIANCVTGHKGHNPLLYVLDRFTPGNASVAMIAGNIVNTLFDALIEDPSARVDDIFEQALQDNVLQLAALGDELTGNVEEQLQDNIDEIHQLVRQQLNTLQHIAANLHGDEIVVEPTFLSAKFGMQGRLDALLDNQDVIELKSGKPPRVGVWSNNEAQAVCYELLMKSTHPNWVGNAQILYSRASNKPLRLIRSDSVDYQGVVALRNQLIWLESQFQQQRLSVIDRINPIEFGEKPKYKESVVAAFSRTMSRLTRLERYYFEVWSAFVAREHHIARVGSNGNGGFASLWRQGRKEKALAFSILPDLVIVPNGADIQTDELTLQPFSGKCPVSTFREGDIVVLYPQGTETPLQHMIIKASIKVLRDDKLTLKLRSAFPPQKHLNNHRHWAIEHDLMDTNFVAMYRSLYEFASAPSDRRSLLLGLGAPAFHPHLIQPFQPVSEHNLTPKQRELIESALKAKDYYLLQGPPGTGKTSTMMREIVHYLHKNTTEMLILLAFTNRAVDEICDTLEKAPEIDYLRLGNEGNTKHSNKVLRRYARAHAVEDTIKRMTGVRVVVATVATFMNSPELAKLKRFDTAIVDEASQLLDVHLVGVLSRVRRFVLIGDQNQLPAVVTQAEQQTKLDNTELHELEVRDLREAYFSRLWRVCKRNGWNAYGMLEDQARMHVDIQALPNECTYDGKLKTITTKQTEPLPDFSAQSRTRLAEYLVKHRVLFFNSPGSASKAERNVHEIEARRVKYLLEEIERLHGHKKTVGVITPYRAQIAQIKREVADSWSDITVDTVERYQGAQRDIIIVSFSVTTPQQVPLIQSLFIPEPESHKNQEIDRKLNVAITRAKEHLILLGNAELLSKNSRVYDQTIRFIQEQGGFVDQWPER